MCCIYILFINAHVKPIGQHLYQSLTGTAFHMNCSHVNENKVKHRSVDTAMVLGPATCIECTTMF